MRSDTGTDETKLFSINHLPSLNLGYTINQSNLLKNQRKSGSFKRAEYPGFGVVFYKLFRIYSRKRNYQVLAQEAEKAAHDQHFISKFGTRVVKKQLKEVRARHNKVR